MTTYRHTISSPIAAEAIYPALKTIGVDVGSPEEFAEVFQFAFTSYDPIRAAGVATILNDERQAVRPIAGPSSAYLVELTRGSLTSDYGLYLRFHAPRADACHSAAHRLSRRLPDQVIRSHCEDPSGWVKGIHFYHEGLWLTRPVDYEERSMPTWLMLH
jgi:hypothetical protein